jgi:hypothetical protein
MDPALLLGRVRAPGRMAVVNRGAGEPERAARRAIPMR